MNTKVKIILQYIASFFCLMFAFVEKGVISSLLLVLSAILFLPIKSMRKFFLEKLKLRGMVVCIIAGVLFVCAVMTGMSNDIDDSNLDNTYSSEVISESESFNESSLEEIIDSSKEESFLEEVAESSEEEYSSEEIIESSEEEYSSEEIIESSEEEYSSEEIIESSEEEYSSEEIIESSEEEYSSEEIIDSSEEEYSSEEIIDSSEEEVSVTYVLNTDSKKIHYPSCWQVDRMSESKKKETDESLEELLEQGYTTCGNCFK